MLNSSFGVVERRDWCIINQLSTQLMKSLASAKPRSKLFRVWKDYYAKVDAVVYLVDAYDKDRFSESKEELDALLSDESLASVPFLILGNNIDIPCAVSEDELWFHLGLSNFTTGNGKVDLTESNVRPLEVFLCSIVRKMGYVDGFKWLSQDIK